MSDTFTLPRPVEAPANTRPADGWPEPDERVVRIDQVDREVKRREREASNAGQDVFAELDDSDNKVADVEENEEEDEYAGWTVDDLRDEAGREPAIEGRHDMRRAELVEALRAREEG